MKTIDTLVEDIYEVVEGKGGWDTTITEYLSTQISTVAETRFSKEQKPRNYLGLSSLGTPCNRKLWYKVNEPEKAEPLKAEALGTFFYGDLLEALVLSLAKAAGHKVEGEQERLDVYGIKGHRDAIIDGWTVDVKSASNFAFTKFEKNQLRQNDPFGYISQLSSYVAAGRDDPRVKEKTKGAFLVVRKERFKLCLDKYDFTEEIENKEKEVLRITSLVSHSSIPFRLFPVPANKKHAEEGKPTNTKLCSTCSYCEFRKHCWPEARTFIYSTGPEYLVDVVKEPRVMEYKE